MGSETCDDNISNWGCSSNCMSVVGGNILGGWNCTNKTNPDNPSFQITVCEEICGDGKRVGNETCDDGTVNNWGCCDALSSCPLKCKAPIDGWNCSNTGTNPTTCSEICDDGLIVGLETCDDQNQFGANDTS